jgi:hypothetical protein
LQLFEERYVERYWDIIDHLSLDALKGLRPDPLPEADNKTIRCYILLCEDQLEMRGSGYISDQTYNFFGLMVFEPNLSSLYSGRFGARFERRLRVIVTSRMRTCGGCWIAAVPTLETP